MNDKVFWSILVFMGCLWVGLYVLLVMPGNEEVAKAEKAMKKSLKNLKELTKQDHIPTDDDLEVLAKGIEKYKDRYKAMVEYYDARDREFELFFGKVDPPIIETWDAECENRFQELKGKFGEAPRLADGEDELEFADFLRVQNAAQTEIDFYNKRWKLMEAVLEATLAVDGWVYEYKADKGIRKSRADDASPKTAFFDRIAGRCKVMIAPSKLEELLRRLLTHRVVNIELTQMQVAKNPEELSSGAVFGIDKEQGGEPPVEPKVYVALELDALDWKFELPEEEKEEVE